MEDWALLGGCVPCRESQLLSAPRSCVSVREAWVSGLSRDEQPSFHGPAHNWRSMCPVAPSLTLKDIQSFKEEKYCHATYTKQSTFLFPSKYYRNKIFRKN